MKITVSLAAAAVAFTAATMATVAHAQTLLVGEYDSNNIYQIAPDGTKTLFAQPTVPSGIRLCGFSFDSAGNLYAARLQGGTANASDPNNGVLKISPTGVVTSFAFAGGLPVDTAVAANGDVYVGSVSGQIRHFTSAGADLGTFATVSGRCDNLAFDASGVLYTASQTAGKINRYAADGTLLGTFATVTGAVGLTFDAGGDVYVGTNTGNIRRFTAAGTDLGVFGFTAGASFTNLAFSPGGDLFAATYSGNKGISRFSATGTALGTFSSGINTPCGLAFAPSVVSAAAPEPVSVALMVFSGGLAAAGQRVRRRRRAIVAGR